MKKINWVLLIVIPLLWAACNKNDKMNIEKSRIDTLKNIQFETEQFADVQIGNDDLPVDRVNGYTANQLEGALIMTTRWNQWRDKIKQQNTNATSGNVDELFANWEF